MNETLKEQISAYVDGELPEGESELLIRRLSQDPALRDLAERYMSIGRVLRGEAVVPKMDELRARIAGELGGELPVAPDVVPERPAGRYLQPVAGVAIAATVAVLALVGLQQVGPVDSPVATTASNDLAAVAIDDAPLYTEPPMTDLASDRPSATLTRYYQQHNERAADIGRSGIFTRLVELELRGGEIAPPIEALGSPSVSPAVSAGADDNDSPEHVEE
jgi:sigma-E factor negative regulatory protein RseA